MEDNCRIIGIHDTEKSISKGGVVSVGSAAGKSRSLVMATAVLSIALGMASPTLAQPLPGGLGTTACNKFSGPVQVEWLDDGRQMKLLAPLTFTDPGCRKWLAPTGSIVDGASIPRIAWSAVGGPFEGKYRDASVVHDVACETKDARWEDAHLMFFNGMIANGVDLVTARIMYAAVFHFGPRWPEPPVMGRGGRAGMPSGVGLPRPPAPPPTLKQEDFARLKDAIEASAEPGKGLMTLEQIRAYKP